jgi:hypothetical protein
MTVSDIYSRENDDEKLLEMQIFFLCEKPLRMQIFSSTAPAKARATGVRAKRIHFVVRAKFGSAPVKQNNDRNEILSSLTHFEK